MAYSQCLKVEKTRSFFFIDPEFRAVIPIINFHISKSLLRLVKKRPFKITINKAFPDVIRSCATINRTETWINKEIENLFISLYKMKQAHSVECWQDNQLVGGIYGLAIGGVFFAESMFSRVPNGSKVALLNLSPVHVAHEHRSLGLNPNLNQQILIMSLRPIVF